MKTKLCDKAKWFLSGIVVVFTCPSLLCSTLLVILASPEGMPNSLGILGRGCLNYGDAKITVTGDWPTQRSTQLLPVLLRNCLEKWKAFAIS